jgi:hypothetical protein
MGDTPVWNGGRLGPYHVSKRCRRIAAELGRIYEGHNVETGNTALVWMPGSTGDWSPRGAWTVRATSGVEPPFFILEVEHAPPGAAQAIEELTLMFHRLAGLLARMEDREEIRTQLTRAPIPRPLGRTLSRHRWWIAGAGAFAVALVLVSVWLWPRPSGSTEAKHGAGVAGAALSEPMTWIDRQDATPALIGYPMPDTAFKGQMKPPCLKGTEVELRGGCWVQLKQDAPCPKSVAEYEGKCYAPVSEKKPEPRSLQP